MKWVSEAPGNEGVTMTTTTVPLRLEIFRGWIGEKEVPGARANPVIAGTPTSWFSLVGHPEVESDEVANCAAAVGASLVLETFGRAGYALADLDSNDPATAAVAEEALAEAIAHTPLPPLETRLLARSYTNFGVDARANPQPGDIVVVPRGAAWQGHVMQLDEVQSGLRRYKCVGANQRDMTSIAYVSFDAEIVAIRRPVAATTKDLLAAGSKAVARGVALKRVGDGLTIGTPLAAATAKAVEAVTAAPEPSSAPMPSVTTFDAIKTGTENLGIVQAFADALVAFGMLFVRYPWLLAPIAAGIIIRVYGVQTIAGRIRQFLAGVPISIATEPQK